MVLGFGFLFGEVHEGFAGVCLDGHVSSDGSSSGSGSSVDSVHVSGDRFHVLLGSNSGSLCGIGGFETSSLASLDRSSVSLGPLDVDLTSGCSSGDGGIFPFPCGCEILFGSGVLGSSSGVCGNGVFEAFLCSLSSLHGISVHGSGDLPLCEGTSALRLHCGLMSKGLEMEALGELGKRSSCLSFGKPFSSGFPGRGLNISCVEVSLDLDSAVSGESHRCSDVIQASNFSFLHGRR